jgi:hypothetical protein
MIIIFLHPVAAWQRMPPFSSLEDTNNDSQGEIQIAYRFDVGRGS